MSKAPTVRRIMTAGATGFRGRARADLLPIDWQAEGGAALRWAIARAKEGHTCTDIAAALGVRREAVSEQVRKAGVRVPMRRPQMCRVQARPQGPALKAPPPAPRIPDWQDREGGFDALPAGHPTSWDLITAGTSMAGTPYPANLRDVAAPGWCGAAPATVAPGKPGKPLAALSSPFFRMAA